MHCKNKQEINSKFWEKMSQRSNYLSIQQDFFILFFFTLQEILFPDTEKK